MQIIITLSEEEKHKVDNCHKALFIDVYNLMAKAIKEGTIISDDPIEKETHHDNKDCIKCHNCGSDMELVTRNRVINNHLLHNVEGYECKCGEIIYTSEQAKAIEAKLFEHGFKFQ